jgi:hypothetical protein
MPKPYSMDLRERGLNRWQRGHLDAKRRNCKSVARASCNLGAALGSVGKYCGETKRWKCIATGKITPSFCWGWLPISRILTLDEIVAAMGQ